LPDLCSIFARSLLDLCPIFARSLPDPCPTLGRPILARLLINVLCYYIIIFN